MNSAALKAIREIGNNSVVYAVRLTFTREFTRGTLVGLTHDDSIGFCNICDAEEWVSSVNRANKAGKVDYKVVKWSTK